MLPLSAWPTGVMVVRDGTIVDGNDLGFVEVGRSSEVVGTPLADLVVESDRAAVGEALRTVGDAPVTLAVTIEPAEPVDLFAPERAVLVELAMRSWGGAVVVQVRSRFKEGRLEAMLDAMADLTMLLDTDGLVEWQSARLQARFVHGSDKWQGSNPIERIHPEDLPGVLDVWANAVADPGSVHRFVARSRDLEVDDVWQRIEMSGSSQLEHPLLRGLVVQVRALDDGEVVDSVAEPESRYHSLAEATPIGIVVSDPWLRTIYRNVAARDLLEQLEIQSTVEWREYVRPAFRKELSSLFSAAISKGDSGTATVAVDLPSGRSRWLRVHVTNRNAVGNATLGLITTLEDVTAEVDARAETERLTYMLDATADYVAVFRPEGEVLYMNQATRGLLEELQAEGKEGHLRDLIDEGPRSEWIASALEVLATSDVWEGELPLNGGGGRKIPVSAVGVIRKSPEGRFEWIAIHARDITESKRAEELQRTLATHDQLTGLPNRTLFNERLDRAVARHRRERRGVAVMFCDLDGFKAINDERGHAAGDRVLVTIAERLRDITRETDTSARVGGDEFVVVCEGVTDTDELATLAERVIETVSRPISLAPEGADAPAASADDTVRVGISIGIGVARSRQLNVDTDKLLTLADTAMYRAKARGGNTFRIAALEDD